MTGTEPRRVWLGPVYLVASIVIPVFMVVIFPLLFDPNDALNNIVQLGGGILLGITMVILGAVATRLAYLKEDPLPFWISGLVVSSLFSLYMILSTALVLVVIYAITNL